jgi:hypothetical protein
MLIVHLWTDNFFAWLPIGMELFSSQSPKGSTEINEIYYTPFLVSLECAVKVPLLKMQYF